MLQIIDNENSSSNIYPEDASCVLFHCGVLHTDTHVPGVMIVGGAKRRMLWTVRSSIGGANYRSI